MIKRLYCAEHEITYYEGGACFYCKQNRERGPKSETQMVDDYRSYTLEVDLEKMPDGWLCFAIGEGKPCIAPPPVMDEIKALVSKLSTLEVERSMDQKLIDSEQGRIKELVGRLDTAMKSIDQLDANLSVVLRSEDEFERRALAAESRLGSIEKFDEASGLCCVKGCTELSVWCCPPLCEHHTALLEPVVETSLPFDEDGLPEMKKLGTLVGKTKPIKPMEPPSE